RPEAERVSGDHGESTPAKLERGRGERLAKSASWRQPRAHGALELGEVGHVSGKLLAIGELYGAVGPFGIQQVEKRCRPSLKSELGCAARILDARQVGPFVER